MRQTAKSRNREAKRTQGQARKHSRGGKPKHRPYKRSAKPEVIHFD